tara:strand:+ start:194914 stop:195597 length:684 start_codon:yes stop_codon:yes gene_type:complete
LWLTGCIPTIEQTYKAPDAKGMLVYFHPEAIDQFVPVAGAKIYHQSYPDKIVFSDENGDFFLPAVTQIELKGLMVGHALAYYPIVIENGPLSYIVLAQADMHMRTLANIELGSIILAQSVDMNTQDLAVDATVQWPCDLRIIQSLDQAVVTAKRLSSAFNNALLMSRNGYAHLTQHYNHSQNLLEAAKNSCHWKEISDAEQHEQIRQSREYFSSVYLVLESTLAEEL